MVQSILITGGAGFIGANVIRAMLNDPEVAGNEGVVLDDLSGGFKDNLPDDPRVNFIQGSITDRKLITRLFQRYHFGWVYHLAAYAAEGLSHLIRGFNYSKYLIGSMNLINASVNYGVECFIFTGSIAVYGKGQVPMHESMAPRPEDPYGIAKYAVQLDLKAVHEMCGLNYVIFRPHNVYGEYQNIGYRYRNVVGIFMNQIIQGKPMTVFGDGGQQRAFSSIGDIASIIARLPLVKGARNRIFNMGADQASTVNDLARKVAEVMEVKPSIVHLPPRNEVMIAYSNHSACREVFGGQPQTPLGDGLRKMAAWVRANGSRKRKEFRGIEIACGLPKSWVAKES